MINEMVLMGQKVYIAGRFVIFSFGDHDYEIPLRDVVTQEGLLRWLTHMAEKRNVTAEHLLQLVRVVAKHNGWDVEL
jgi:hypothetical protein